MTPARAARAAMLALALAAGPLRAPAAAQSEGVSITLPDAIARSLAVQPAMVQAEGERRNAAAGDRAAWGAFLPSLTTSASATRSSRGRIGENGLPIGKGYSYNLGVNANLELFDGFRRYAELKSSSANSDAAEASWLDNRAQVTLATKQAFFDAVVQEDLVRAAEAQLERAQRQLDLSLGKVRAGSGTKSDSLRSTVELGNARIALLRVRGALTSARAALGRQIGVDEPVRAVVGNAVPAVPDTAAIREEALAVAPQIAESDARLRAARAGVWSARAQYWPTLGLSYADSRQGDESPFTGIDDYEESFSWRFGLSWTILNGFQREENQVRAAVQRDVAAAEADDTRRRISSELTRELTALALAYEQIAIAAANLEAAAEDFRVQGERYRLGASTVVDLSTAQANMTEAEVSMIRSRLDFFTARAQVEALVGHDL